jgi:hypothetical protein
MIRENRILHIFIALLCLIFLATLYLTPPTTNDIWLHIATGRNIIDLLQIPQKLLFSYTHAGDFNVVAHEWFAALLISIIDNLSGYNGLIFAKYFISILIFYFLTKLSIKITQNLYLSLFITAFILYIINYRSFLRPEIFSYLLLSIQLNYFYRFYKNQDVKSLTLISFISIIWANTHGSFIISFAISSLLAIDILFTYIKLQKNKINLTLSVTKIRLTLFLPIACLISFTINPSGVKLFQHIYKLGNNTFIRKTIFEWFPMTHSSVMGTQIYSLFLFHLFIVFILILFFNKKLTFFSWSIAGLFLFLSLSSQRHLVYFALISSWPISIMLSRNNYKKIYNKLLYVSLCMTLSLSSYLFYNNGNTLYIKAGLYKLPTLSQTTIKHIKEKITGNVINSYNLGAYLTYYFYPKIKILIDSRIDAYGKNYMQYYQGIFRQKPKKFFAFTDKYKIKHILLDRRLKRKIANSNYPYLLKERGWIVSFSNHDVTILSRKHTNYSGETSVL